MDLVRLKGRKGHFSVCLYYFLLSDAVYISCSTALNRRLKFTQRYCKGIKTSAQCFKHSLAPVLSYSPATYANPSAKLTVL